MKIEKKENEGEWGYEKKRTVRVRTTDRKEMKNGEPKRKKRRKKRTHKTVRREKERKK